MGERTRICTDCRRPFVINARGRPQTRCEDCTPTVLARQRVARAADPPPNALPCADCSRPVAQAKPIDHTELLCTACSITGTIGRRFVCACCSIRAVREARRGPQNGRGSRGWLCDRCAQAMKWCARCDRILPRSEFSTANGKPDGNVSHCRACSKRTYHATTDKDADTARKFGLTKEQYVQMHVDRDYRCDICGVHKSQAPRGYLYVDHDHACCNRNGSCGACVRGLLCLTCNFGLGSFHDRADLLVSAARYIQEVTTPWPVARPTKSGSDTYN